MGRGRGIYNKLRNEHDVQLLEKTLRNNSLHNVRSICIGIDESWSMEFNVLPSHLAVLLATRIPLLKKLSYFEISCSFESEDDFSSILSALRYVPTLTYVKLHYNMNSMQITFLANIVHKCLLLREIVFSIQPDVSSHNLRMLLDKIKERPNIVGVFTGWQNRNCICRTNGDYDVYTDTMQTFYTLLYIERNKQIAITTHIFGDDMPAMRSPNHGFMGRGRQIECRKHKIFGQMCEICIKYSRERPRNIAYEKRMQELRQQQIENKK